MSDTIPLRQSYNINEKRRRQLTYIKINTQTHTTKRKGSVCDVWEKLLQGEREVKNVGKVQ